MSKLKDEDIVSFLKVVDELRNNSEHGCTITVDGLFCQFNNDMEKTIMLSKMENYFDDDVALTTTIQEVRNCIE